MTDRRLTRPENGTTPPSTTPDKVLLVKGAAGLGNRMHCALMGILYARFTGRRLLVDWSDHYYSTDGSNVFYRFFLCSAVAPSDAVLATESVSPAIWRGHLHESAWSMRKRYGDLSDSEQALSIDLTRQDYQEDVIVMWMYHARIDLLRGHFRGAFKQLAAMSDDAILRELLHEALGLHPDIRKRVDQFKDGYFRRRTVGIHVRYTDYRTRLWAIMKQLHMLLKREPDLQIFLATDNRQIKNMFEANYPGVMTTPHWYSSTPGVAIHSSRDQPDPMQSGIDALVDLYLLAECDYLIIDTSSTFSHVAKLLAKTPGSNILDVREGGKPFPHRRRLIHRLMLKLGVYSWGLSLFSRFVRLRRSFPM